MFYCVLSYICEGVQCAAGAASRFTRHSGLYQCRQYSQWHHWRSWYYYHVCYGRLTECWQRRIVLWSQVHTNDTSFIQLPVYRKMLHLISGLNSLDYDLYYCMLDYRLERDNWALNKLVHSRKWFNRHLFHTGWNRLSDSHCCLFDHALVHLWSCPSFILLQK